MPLPTGRNAQLLSLRAKFNKAHALATDLHMAKVAAKAFELFTLVDTELSKTRKAPKTPETDDDINEGDDAAE